MEAKPQSPPRPAEEIAEAIASVLQDHPFTQDEATDEAESPGPPNTPKSFRFTRKQNIQIRDFAAKQSLGYAQAVRFMVDAYFSSRADGAGAKLLRARVADAELVLVNIAKRVAAMEAKAEAKAKETCAVCGGDGKQSCCLKANK